ncbi:hypothetical protein [Mycobacterium sp. OTB74]|uniref:hypothetical protein n=1 Tax=Mycobacterium sp. OTB74 TaxID=1853452 RepID=UPI002474C0E9|nr:hypothetical protein [Mycobacterium sp. OTB74]MDH6246655.1 hypothetical protein [Mycobacterium sp. OTB74]
MGKDQLAKGRRHLSAAVAAIIVPATAVAFVGADDRPVIEPHARCCAAVAAAPPQMIPPAPAARPVPPPQVRHPLPAGVAPERGLQVETILAARAVSARFPQILTIGGVRPDSLKWHPDGLAIDVMLPNYATPEGKALGDQIVAFVLANADRFDVNHVIFRQEMYFKGDSHKRMSDRGGITANHYDHVHIATNGGGFPTGHETYLT